MRRSIGASIAAAAVVLAPTSAAAQRVRERLGIAAEDDGGSEPLGDGIHPSGAVRTRIEVRDNATLFPQPERGDGYAYHRLLGAVDVRHGPLRAYVQAGVWQEQGSNWPRVPLSTDRGDVQQAFVDLTLGPKGRQLRLRGGRQELSYEFIAQRDNPNVRRAWDGARATALIAGWELDAFAMRLVTPRLGAFDDASSGGDRLSGLHLLSPAGEERPFYLSAYAYGVRQRAVVLFPTAQPARTGTAGAAIDGRAGRLLYRASAAVQWGRTGARRQSAHAYEALVGWTWPDARWQPTVALRTDGFSGGSPDARVARTWNPLFPDYAYSTEAALQQPSNLRKAGLYATAKRGKLDVSYRGEGLWRFSARDAFYGPAGTQPVVPDGTAERWVGLQQQLLARYAASETVTVTAAYVNLRAGSFLRRAGQPGQHFSMIQAEWRF